MSFRFEEFADASSAQAAFEASFPPGSPAEPALQALVDMGAQCKVAGPARVACRYMETPKEVAGWCWYVALEGNDQKAIQRIRIGLAMLAI